MENGRVETEMMRYHYHCPDCHPGVAEEEEGQRDYIGCHRPRRCHCYRHYYWSYEARRTEGKFGHERKGRVGRLGMRAVEGACGLAMGHGAVCKSRC